MSFSRSLIFIFALAISCNDEEVKPKSKASVTIDGVNMLFVNIDGYAVGDYFSLEGEEDNSIFFGNHILSSDSLRNLINIQTTPKLKAEKAIEIMQHLMPTYGQAVSIVDRDQYECFTCFHQIVSPAYSITYMENMSDLSNKEVWTSSYKEQINAELNITNLNVIEEYSKFLGFNTFYIKGELEFKCSLANDLGEVKQIYGRSDVVFFEFY